LIDVDRCPFAVAVAAAAAFWESREERKEERKKERKKEGVRRRLQLHLGLTDSDCAKVSFLNRFASIKQY
jgi:hypothetical protein